MGFSLIEIIISLAILSVVLASMFYFVSSINVKNKIINSKPYALTIHSYGNKYCYIDENQPNIPSVLQVLNLSKYISTSTPVTSISIFHKNKMILTTNSASTTEKDIFLFNFNTIDNQINLDLLQSLDIGPGINDAILHDNFIYVLNTSINSHVKTFKVNPDNNALISLGSIKINELSTSGALPKKVYLYNKNLLIGTEKNNSGGELFFLPLDETSNDVKLPTKSQEIGGQVSGVFADQDMIYIANASDTELFVYEKNFALVYSYDAPLSLGNGKSVYYLDPYIYLGRTVASFELFLLEIKNFGLHFLNKYKAYGTIDFIQTVNQNLLIISSAEDKELQFFTKNLSLLKIINLPSRVISYNCFEDSFLFAMLINNQPHILWLK